MPTAVHPEGYYALQEDTLRLLARIVDALQTTRPIQGDEKRDLENLIYLFNIQVGRSVAPDEPKAQKAIVVIQEGGLIDQLLFFDNDAEAIAEARRLWEETDDPDQDDIKVFSVDDPINWIWGPKQEE